MSKNYIIFDGDYPEVTNHLEVFQPTRLAVLTRFWEGIVAYDCEKTWRPQVNTEPRFNGLQILLARTVWNPTEELEWYWREDGPSDLTQIIERIKSALKDDDDIMTQWLAPQEIKAILVGVSDFHDLVLAVRPSAEHTKQTQAFETSSSRS